jgi:hypothetical protein
LADSASFGEAPASGGGVRVRDEMSDLLNGWKIGVSDWSVCGRRKRYLRTRTRMRRIDSCPKRRPCVNVGVKEKM